MTTSVWAERCRAGRLRLAYPTARRDVELRVEGVTGDSLAEVLANETARLLEDDPGCRKVVYAAPAGDLDAMTTAERAGFRYVVDVDVIEEGRLVELSLLVREPDFVTRADMDIDRVPQS